MKPSRWQQISDAMAIALELNPNDRERYLSQLCLNDRALQEEVAELLELARRAEAEDFLCVPPWALEAIPLKLADFGSYKDIEYVGHGGMGVVYKAYQSGLNRQVAIKVSHHTERISAADEERFRAEAENMARLQHPNIVKIYEVGTRDDQPYFCMEFIRGNLLSERLTDFASRPHHAAQLMKTIAQAVHHAHQRGLLHRDLKPGNILLDEAGQPYVTDFGLAKKIEYSNTPERPAEKMDWNRLHAFRGTAAFMSPEQVGASDEQETVLSDVFGLGALLYALLTGRGPHQGSTIEETIKKIKTCSPKPVRLLNPKTDKDLEAMCMKALAKAPNQRHDSAQQFAEDLQCWCNGTETTARPWTFFQRLNAWRRRNPAFSILASSTLLLFIIATVLFAQRLFDIMQEPERAQMVLARNRTAIIDVRLRQLRQVVHETATDPNLIDLFRSKNREKIQQYINDIGTRRTDLNGRSPFSSWFVTDQKATFIARWPRLPSTIKSRAFDKRDYCTDVINRRSKGPRVTRVYRSLADDSYKFGISMAVQHQGAILGVLAATVPTSPTLGLPSVDMDESYTIVTAGVDPSYYPKDAARAGCKRIILLHPSFESGGKPKCASNTQLPKSIGVYKGYRDPYASIDKRFEGKWLGAVQPVPNTDFMVLVQHRFPGIVGISTKVAIGIVGTLLIMIGIIYLGRKLMVQT